MENINEIQRILSDESQLGPFPMHRLKRVEKPTSIVTDTIGRVDMREAAFARAERGEYGAAVKKASSVFLPLKYPVSAALYDVLEHFTSSRGEEVAAVKALVSEDPQVLNRHIKRMGYFLKADIVGICRLPKSAVYSHDNKGNLIDIDYKNAIVLVIGKEYKTMDASDGFDWIGDAISFQTYMRLAFATEVMASYIRKLGYPASPQSTAGGREGGGYQVLIPPLLLWAGIGEVSRAGIILNPFLGMGFKAAAVLTDMPLEPDSPIDFGLQRYCRDCKICAQMCPSRSISTGEKVMYNGYETWKLDERSCAGFSLTNTHGTICNMCIKVCPWTRPVDRRKELFRRAVGYSSLTCKLALKAGNLLSRSKPDKDKKWWFDIKYGEGDPNKLE